MNPNFSNMRLIVFVELVRGCDNTKCPSYGHVCDYDGKYFMSEETLLNAIAQINQTMSLGFKKIDLWAYGCGDSLDHPDLGWMLRLIQKNLDDRIKVSMSIDSQRSFKDGLWWSFLDHIKIVHKNPPDNWDVRAYEIMSHSGYDIPIEHKLITRKVTRGIVHSAWRVLRFDNVPKVTASTLHDVPLGKERVDQIKRVPFKIDPSVMYSKAPYSGLMAKRAMFAYDGSLRTCLIETSTHGSLMSHLLADDACADCFKKMGSQLIQFGNESVHLMDLCNCVSDGPS